MDYKNNYFPEEEFNPVNNIYIYETSHKIPTLPIDSTRNGLYQPAPSSHFFRNFVFQDSTRQHMKN